MIDIKCLKGTVIVYWNVRSILNKIIQIHEYLVEYDIDVLCVSESWLHESIPNDQLSCKGYQIVRLDRQRNGLFVRGGGLCIYVKDKYMFVECTEKSLRVSDTDTELLTIQIKLKNTRPIFITNLYRPPCGNIETFITTLHTLFTHIDTYRQADIIMGGDFNIDYSTAGGSRKNLKDLEKIFGLKQLITDPTRPLYNKAIIDLFLTNTKEIRASGVLDFNVSDHSPIFIQRKRLKSESPKEHFSGRTYRNYTSDKMKTCLANFDFSFITYNFLDQALSVDDQWDIIYNALKTIADNLCPVRSSSFSKTKPPWLSKELIELSRDKDRALKIAGTSGLYIDKQSARHIRNRCNVAFKLARRKYIMDNLTEFADNPKKFWQYIREIMPKGRSQSILKLINDHTDQSIPYDQTAQYINNFFSQVGQSLANAIISIPSTFNAYDHLQNGIRNDNPITEPPNKCSLPLIPLDYLRPISLLPIPGKILERHVYTVITNFLETNKLLSKFQNGFRKNHGKIDTVFKFLMKITQNLNNNIPTISLFIDFKKAFDTISHVLLLKKILFFG